jgi:hypothetical protein
LCIQIPIYTPCFTGGPWSSDTPQGADQHNGPEEQSHGSWWFPWRTDFQGIVFKMRHFFSNFVHLLAYGSVYQQYVGKPGVAFCTNVADDRNSITNAVDVYESPK